MGYYDDGYSYDMRGAIIDMDMGGQRDIIYQVHIEAEEEEVDIIEDIIIDPDQIVALVLLIRMLIMTMKRVVDQLTLTVEVE